MKETHPPQQGDIDAEREREREEERLRKRGREIGKGRRGRRNEPFIRGLPSPTHSNLKWIVQQNGKRLKVAEGERERVGVSDEGDGGGHLRDAH
jgi:hypothetical protein